MSRFVFAAALACAALGATPASAQPLETIWQEANAAWFAGDRDTASAGWERLVEAGVRDADVYFNLGTAHGEAGRYGRAVLSFERALAIRPGDEDAAGGLATARTALGRRRADAEGEAVVRARPPFAESVTRAFSKPTLAWSALVLEALFFLLLVAWRSARSEPVRLGLAIASPAVGVLMLLAFYGWGVKAQLWQEGSAGIVVVDDAPLREGPHGEAQRRGDAREGEVVRIVDEDETGAGAFVRVDLPGGRGGWLAAEHVGRVDPDAQ